MTDEERADALVDAAKDYRAGLIDRFELDRRVLLAREDIGPLYDELYMQFGKRMREAKQRIRRINQKVFDEIMMPLIEDVVHDTSAIHYEALEKEILDALDQEVALHGHSVNEEGVRNTSDRLNNRIDKYIRLIHFSIAERYKKFVKRIKEFE